MNEIRINSIDSLCKFISEHKPSLSLINQILWHMDLKAIIINEHTPEEYCNQITAFWAKWKDIKEKPLFIDYE